MSELYRLASRITELLESRHRDDMIGLVRAKGEVAVRTGFLVTLITPHDPDDPEKLRLLREAAIAMDITP